MGRIKDAEMGVSLALSDYLEREKRLRRMLSNAEKSLALCRSRISELKTVKELFKDMDGGVSKQLTSKNVEDWLRVKEDEARKRDSGMNTFFYPTPCDDDEFDPPGSEAYGGRR